MRKSKGDMAYFLPKGKKPIAWGTVATSELIALMAEDFETIEDVRNAITFDLEAKEILDIYIEKGFGQSIARDFFK